MKKTLVTGAGSGIGRAIALMLANDGHQVIAADLNWKSVEETARFACGDVQPLSLDVSKREQVDELFSSTLLNGMTNLVNNAGIGFAGTVVETAPEEWDRLFRVNVEGTFLMCHYAVPTMIKMGGGQIVNIASIAGLVGLKRRAAYCASKAAVIGLTRAIAVDFAAEGIRCNAVAPGTVASPWIENIIAGSTDPETQRASMAARQLDGKMGSPEEVAGAVSFLLGPSGRFANGSVLVLDGGVTAA